MKSLNCVVYGHILIERVIEEVERMLTAVNINKVFIQVLTLVLSHCYSHHPNRLIECVGSVNYTLKVYSSV